MKIFPSFWGHPPHSQDDPGWDVDEKTFPFFGVPHSIPRMIQTGMGMKRPPKFTEDWRIPQLFPSKYLGCSQTQESSYPLLLFKSPAQFFQFPNFFFSIFPIIFPFFPNSQPSGAPKFSIRSCSRQGGKKPPWKWGENGELPLNPQEKRDPRHSVIPKFRYPGIISPLPPL